MVYLHGKFIDFRDMKKSLSKGLILVFLFNSLVVISLNTTGQEWIAPIQNTILLSGNFAELRATHFHSGIDIRTGGVEGLPVVCVKDGVLARVGVSPTGYGQVLYIEHADGTTTVYGHLQRFVPQIAEIVRKIQYDQESFRIDEDMRSYGLTFRQGDTIAYSGNTGSSGGPHLHFEIRDTRTEYTVNPLHYYRIRDTKSPVVRMIYLYSISDEGVVEFLRQCPVKQIQSGCYEGGQVSVPAGRIGIGVYAVDYMNDSWNKLGIYDMSLMAAGDTLFRMKTDTCSFGQSCFINDVKDFDKYKKKETVYRCFGNYQEQFKAITNKNKGNIIVSKDSVVKVKVWLADRNGNQTTVSLKLKGKQNNSEQVAGEEILRYDRAHILQVGDCLVKIDSGGLFFSTKKRLCVEKDTLSGRDIFVLSEKEVPLFKKAHLFIRGVYTPKAIICEVNASGKKFPLETRLEAEGVSANIGYLNRYTVVEDREAPTITYLGKLPGQTLGFRIKDDLSGIAAYRGEVNGKWCLFSYDPRVNLLKCSLMEPVFEVGKTHEIKITVTDKAGNVREKKISL